MNGFFNYKSRLFKVTLTTVAALLILHYWRYVSLDSHSMGPLFVINKMRGIHPTDGGNVTFSIDANAFYHENSSHNATAGNVDRIGNETVLCPPVPPNLNGAIDVNMNVLDLTTLEKLFPELEPGGVFRPHECRSLYVVALVIPYRNRHEQLSVFLNNIHRLLMKQQIDYGIFVVEQEGDGEFNRGKLMNVGFVEALKIRHFDCFIFHDVDLIPEDDRNLYTCPVQPRHMSVAIDKFDYKLPYNQIFGGVSAMTTAHFKLVNGFSNKFWGWGGEDDDMSSRIRRRGLEISRYPPTIARYRMLYHSKAFPNPRRFQILFEGTKSYATDGLNSLTYERKALELRRLYTWILADLKPPS